MNIYNVSYQGSGMGYKGQTQGGSAGPSSYPAHKQRTQSRSSRPSRPSQGWQEVQEKSKSTPNPHRKKKTLAGT